ncbi:MAG: pyrroline-5-carboxylate reductase [Ornithinimicrobium sp.]
MGIAILGAGVMGRTLLSAFLRAGHDPAGITVSDSDEERAREVGAALGVDVVGPAAAARVADVLVLAVKPQDMDALLSEIAEQVNAGSLVISIAAGISTDVLEDRLGCGVSVVRAMPNTPALVDQAMSVLAPGRHCDPGHAASAESLMGTVGAVTTLDEGHFDAVTALSGSGPAYIFYVVEAMIEAGVLLGLPRVSATELTVQTLYGAASMMRETGQHPTVLREQVSSPGGTSVAALRQLDDHKVRAAFLTAIEAAARRSRELSAGQ